MDESGAHGDDSDGTTPRGENLKLQEDEGVENTLVPAYYGNTTAENLHALAERFYGYYRETHNPEHLDWVIKHEKEAALTYLPNHPGRLQSFVNLAGYYYERYEISRDLEDLGLSVEKSADVERRTTADDSIRPDALSFLARGLLAYYHRDGKQENLEGAIRHSSDAVILYPAGHRSQGETLITLSTALYDRYQVFLNRGDSQLPHNDLDDAISYSIKAVSLFPTGDRRLSYSHTRLSWFLFTRHQRRKDPSDLRLSVHHARLALVDLAPEGRPDYLIHLGYLLTHLSHDPQILMELAKCSKEAIDLIPHDDHRRIGAIQNLVTASHRMYITLNSVAHLDEAIDYNRLLLRFLPHGSAQKHSQLRLHHNLLEYRWNEKKFDMDFTEMTETGREITRTEPQSYYSYHPSAQPPMRPPPTSNPPSAGSPIARSFEYRPPQHWSPRPYYYDDSAVSLAGNNYSTTGSAETGHYGNGNETSLVGHTMNLSFIEPDPDNY